MEFLARLEQAWAVCDRFDLQTEIWRGRILRAVRDREKRGGEGRGAGFLQWLREREISKTRAYGLIQLAESADDLVGGGMLQESSVNYFSKRAFLETAQAAPEVQVMISEAANEGQEITRKQVRRLSDEFTAATSPLLPEEIRQRTQENLLPPRAVAPLVRELAKLPEPQQDDFRKLLKEEPELDRIKDVTSTARWITKATEAGVAVRAFQQGELDLEKAMQEAQHRMLSTLADAVGQAQALEAAVLKLHMSWRRLGGLQERLWVESGAARPICGMFWMLGHQRIHHAGVPGRPRGGATGAASARGGSSGPVGTTSPALTPHLVFDRMSPLLVVDRGSPGTVAPSPFRLVRIPSGTASGR